MSSSQSAGFVVRVIKKTIILFFSINILFCLLISHDILDIVSFRFWGTRFFTILDYFVEMVKNWIHLV